MATQETSTMDALAMALGGGLVLLGGPVFGFFETILGNPHALDQTSDSGDVIAHTTFDPNLRAIIIALGLVVLFLWAVYRLAIAIREGGPRTT